MTQADRVHSTPPLNSPSIPSRRTILGALAVLPAALLTMDQRREITIRLDSLYRQMIGTDRRGLGRLFARPPTCL
jgi:hypothetical protein